MRAVRHLASTSRAGQAFAGTPAVGALFTMSAGQLGQHFCTASVVDSPDGDLAITAAHCVTGTSGTVAFVPGYDHGHDAVRRVDGDQGLRRPGVELLVEPGRRLRLPARQPARLERAGRGRDRGGTASHRHAGQPASWSQVIGYPNATDQPITCQNRLSEPMADQLEFDCGWLHGRDQRRAVPEQGQTSAPGRAW